MGLRQLASDARAIVGSAWRHDLGANATPRGVSILVRSLLQGRRDFFLGVAVHAVNTPHAPAVSDAHRTLTYRELDSDGRALAANLYARGVRAGDRVGCAIDNRAEYFVAMAGLSLLGAVPASISPKAARPELVRRLRSAAATAAIVEEAHAETAAQALESGERVFVLGDDAPAGTVPFTALLQRGAPPPPPPDRQDAPDVVLYTSGTTGRSKGTRINLRKARAATAFRYLDGFDIGPDTVLYTPCPLYHAAPMVLTGLTLTVGGHVVVRERFEDETVADLWLHWEVTHAFLVPTLLDRLSRRPEAELQRLRRGPLRGLISGGAALRPALKVKLLSQLGPVLYDFYGATELGVVSIARPADLACEPATVGRILPGVSYRLVDDDGRPVGPGERGELHVSSDATSEGYEHDPHGLGTWVTAGDICEVRDGLLFIVDRKRDVVISGGVNIFPVDVEEAVERFGAVREAAALGVPDETWGEALHVFVVPEEGQHIDLAALDAHCREELARYAIPKAVHIVDALPRSPTGKLLRRELRDRLISGSSTAPGTG